MRTSASAGTRTTANWETAKIHVSSRASWRPRLPTGPDVEHDGADRDQHDRPPRDLADEDEDALDERDDERDPEATLAQSAAEAALAVLDRQRAIHTPTVRAQPYQVGTVSQVLRRAPERRAAPPAAWRR